MAAGDYQGTYAAEKVIVSIGGIPVSGFADGTFITAKYEADRYFKKVGADGEVSRAKNADKSGTIELVLSQTSASNDALTALFGLSSLAGVDPVVPVSVTDLSGRSLVSASKCWLKTAPEATFGREIGERTWTLEAADMLILVGGNN